MKILILMLLVVSCTEDPSENQIAEKMNNQIPTAFKFNCVRVMETTHRCENKEVVCYVYKYYSAGGLAGGLSCISRARIK